MNGLRWGTLFGVLLSSFVVAAPYTVQAKETLYSISKKFNVPMAVLTRVNNLTSTDLKVGQVLEIPERNHTVIKGDTLFGIAKQYGTTVQALSELNKLGSSGIKLGQVLLIPWDTAFFGSSAPIPPVSSSSAPPVIPTATPAIPKPPAPPIVVPKPVMVNPSSPPISLTVLPIPVISAPISNSSWRAEPSTVLAQLPPPERPVSTFPTDPSSAKPKVWTLLKTAPLPVLIPPDPIPTPLVSSPIVPDTELILTYTIVSGDTLFNIAKRFGLTVELLRSRNALSSDSLRLGQILIIPEANLAQDKSLREISERYLGVNYVFGGSSANGLDCSGFTSIVFKELGINLPRVSREQFSVGTPVEPDQLREGDLVFFDTTGKGVSHVGIYLSDDEFIHAASNPGRVLKSKLSEKYYAARYLGARRVITDD